MECNHTIRPYIMEKQYMGPISKTCILPFEIIQHIFFLLKAENRREMQAMCCVSKQWHWLANAGRRAVYGDETKAFGKAQALLHFNTSELFKTCLGDLDLCKSSATNDELKKVVENALGPDEIYQEFISLPLTCDKILKSPCPLFSSEENPKTIQETHSRFIRIFKGLNFETPKGPWDPSDFYHPDLEIHHIDIDKEHPCRMPIDKLYWVLMTLESLPKSDEKTLDQQLQILQELNSTCYFQYSMPKTALVPTYCLSVEYISGKRISTQIRCQDELLIADFSFVTTKASLCVLKGKKDGREGLETVGVLEFC